MQFAKLRIRKKLASLTLEQGSSIENLDKSLQVVAASIIQGNSSSRLLAQVLSDEGVLMRQHFDHHFIKLEAKQEELQAHQEQIRFNERFLESFNFPDIRQRQESIKEAHTTFRWIFDKSGEKVKPWSNFIDWLESGSGTYWINGKAGSGKSTIMRFIVKNPLTSESLDKWADGKKLLTPAFFFWAAGFRLQKSVDGFLRSVIFQILDHHRDVIPFIANKYITSPMYVQTLQVWTESELRDCFLTLAARISGTFRTCLIVDGLDESSGDHYELIQLIRDILRLPDIKCLVSSRPEAPFNELKPSCMLKLQDLTKKDIWNLVKTELRKIPQMQSLSREEAKERERLQEMLVNKASGVFIWVTLAVKEQVNGIRNHDSLEQLTERLNALPSDVEELYHGMLKKIDRAYRKEAARHLGFTLYLSALKSNYHVPNIESLTIAFFGLTDSLRLSEEELTPDILDEKCSLINKRISIVCAGFLEVHDSNLTQYKFPDLRPTSIQRSSQAVDWCLRLVQFPHRTAKDFFTAGQLGGIFLQQHGNFPEHSGLLPSAEILARMRLCTRNNFHLHISLHVHRLVASARAFEPKSSGQLEASMSYFEYLDRTITELDQRVNSSADPSPWWHRGYFGQGSLRIYFSGTLPPEESGGHVLPSRFVPADLTTFAAAASISWYVQGKLDEIDIEPEKAAHLAVWIGLGSLSSGVKYWDHGYNYAHITQIVYLLHKGADVTREIPMSIWADTLKTIYVHKLGGIYSLSAKGHNPLTMGSLPGNLVTDRAITAWIGAFLDAGASPTQVICLGADRQISKSTWFRGIEIDFSRLPVVKIDHVNDDRIHQRYCSHDLLYSVARKPLRIWFKDKFDFLSRPFRECVMSEVQVQEVFGIVRRLLDEPALKQKTKIWGELDLCLVRNFPPSEVCVSSDEEESTKSDTDSAYVDGESD